MGQKLMTFVERMDAPAPNTFRIFLREACGIMLEALGKPSSNVPFIMPKRIAETPADKQIEEHIGSGPYVFKRDEFKPGDKAVYVKNTEVRAAQGSRLRAPPAASTSTSTASSGTSRCATRRRRSTRSPTARSTCSSARRSRATSS